MEKLEKSADTPEKKHDFYLDKSSGIRFLHDFRCGIPFEDEYKNVTEKYNRRITRLYQEINKSNKILLIWQCTDAIESEENIRRYYKQLTEKFSGKEIYMLIIEHDLKEYKKYLENKHILILRYDNIIKDTNGNTTVLGNKEKNKEIFTQIKRKIPLKELPKQILFKLAKILIGMIPNRELRPVLREAFDRHFYKAKLQ